MATMTAATTANTTNCNTVISEETADTALNGSSTNIAATAPPRRKRKRIEREKLTVGRTTLFRGHSLALRPELKPLSTSKIPPSALLHKLKQFLPKIKVVQYLSIGWTLLGRLLDVVFNGTCVRIVAPFVRISL